MQRCRYGGQQVSRGMYSSATKLLTLSREFEDELCDAAGISSTIPPRTTEASTVSTSSSSPRTRSITLEVTRDATIYEDGSLSNGAGAMVFAGLNEHGLRRRALLFFGITGSVPSGATIESAQLTLTVTHAPGAAAEALGVQLHALNRGWSEGTVVARGTGLAGGNATTGDVTWAYATYESTQWSSLGGDFAPEPLANATAGAVGGTLTFRGSALTAALQVRQEV